jgi:hypothetical protein
VTTSARVTVKWDLKALPNYVDKAERKRREAGLCIKCRNSGHTIKDCKVGWKVPTIKEEKAKCPNLDKGTQGWHLRLYNAI